MFNVGGGEVLVILLVALLVLGPDKLPDAARNAGRLYRQVRQLSSGFQEEIRDAMGDPPAPAGPSVHPEAGRGPSLPPLAPAAAAGADGSAASVQASVPDLDDLDDRAHDPVTDRSLHVDGPDASFT